MDYTIYYFIGSILGIFFLGYLAEYILSSSFSQKTFRYFVAPGILLHESAHALTAILFGGKILEFKIFDEKGGSVKYSQPKFPQFSNIIIALAPIIFAIIALILLIKLFNYNYLFQNNQLISWIEIKNYLKSLDYQDYKTYLFLYLALSISASMTPSKKDLALSWAGLAFFLIISILCYFLVPQTIVFFNYLLPTLIWCINLFIIVCVLSAFIYLIKWVIILIIIKFQSE